MQPAMTRSADPATVAHVDLNRYLGLWYEIARLPMWAEDDGARDVTAEYALKDDGRIRVVNRCIAEDGQVEEAEGEAQVVEGSGNARRRPLARSGAELGHCHDPEGTRRNRSPLRRPARLAGGFGDLALLR